MNDTLNKLAFVLILLLYRLTLTTDWGHHTGTIDWCETNYSHSPYIAEFVNTLTNLPSILLGIYGVWHTTQNGIPLRYGLCYLGLSLIGVGSFGFHASLRWEWQLMDELPMVSRVVYSFRGEEHFSEYMPREDFRDRKKRADPRSTSSLMRLI